MILLGLLWWLDRSFEQFCKLVNTVKAIMHNISVLRPSRIPLREGCAMFMDRGIAWVLEIKC